MSTVLTKTLIYDDNNHKELSDTYEELNKNNVVAFSSRKTPEHNVNGFRYLKTVRFKSTFNWSVAYLSKSNVVFSQNYPLIKVGEFLKRNKTSVQVEDNEIYKRVTIKLYGGGVKTRDKVIGREIGTKNQFVVRKGQFLSSSIDARNGAFGVATEEIEVAIVTNDFPVYDIDEKLIYP